MNLGYRLRVLRESKKLSLRQLERMSGVSNSMISQIENGKKTNPSLDTINRLAEALGVEPSFLLGGDSSENSISPTLPIEPQQEFEKFGDLIINDEKVELYRKVINKEQEREEAAAIETELTPEELQEIEDDKILASVEMMAAHMNPDAYDKPLSRETKNLIANAIREVRRKYGKKKTE